MKSVIFASIIAAAFAATASTTVTTNFAGTVATRQQLLALVCPAYDVQWETNVLQDTEGAASESYVGPHCDVLIANWLAASTTNSICTYSNELFRVNGREGKVTVGYDGLIRLGIEDYEDTGDTGRYRPRISIEEKHVGFDFTRIKWRYYRWNNTNNEWKYREFTMTMTATPRWRFALQQSP